MEDADRLFDCLRCGLSTPKSALKERTKRIGTSSRESLRHGETSEFTEFSSPASAKHRHPNTAEKLVTPTVRTIKFNSGKQISPVVFYGSPHGVPAKRPSQLLRLLREIQVDLAEQNDLHLRKGVWATFPRQDDAVKFARSHAKVSVFSYQDHLNGHRRFLVSTYEEFWRRYKNMNSKFRHHYEVIQEGAPCHLYFDLEFNKRVNAEKNVDRMVDLLISVIFGALFDKYSIQGDQQWIIELDSSTKEKASRHLIIRVPNVAFRDNSHAGAFVTEICSRISSERERDPRLEELYVLKDVDCAEPSRLFLDTAVYSRNRCFRLALSSKAGKNSVLLPTGRFKCKNMSEKEMFMDSLICRMDPDCEKLLICKMDFDCMKILCFDSEAKDSQEETLNARKDVTCRNFLPGSYCTGNSPFPALDTFVESIACTGNVTGRIRSWYWFSDFDLIVYSMSGNRYCERIGRQHKSNHVMYIVDFKRAGYYQKCYDPDCKGFRSRLRPIPVDAIPDRVSAFKLTQVEHDQEVMNIDFKCQIDGKDVNPGSFDCDGSGESSKLNRGWWLEAIRAAEDIEGMRKTLEFPGLDFDGCDEDDEWWTNVEITSSQIEERNSQTIFKH